MLKVGKSTDKKILVVAEASHRDRRTLAIQRHERAQQDDGTIPKLEYGACSYNSINLLKKALNYKMES